MPSEPSGAARPQAPEVNLVICTAGARREQLLRAISCARRAIDRTDHPTELIVVDNSLDGSLMSWEPLSDLRVVRAPWPGLSFARITACNLASGDIIVFVDDDVEVPSDWLQSVIEPIAAGDADIVASRIHLSPAFGGMRLPVLCRQWLAENDEQGEPRLVGAAMAFTRRMLAVAVWDTQLGAGPGKTGYGEEHLFELMCRSAGARIAYSPGPAAVHHPAIERATAAQFMAEAVKKGRSAAYIAHHWHGTTLKAPRLRTVVRSLRARRARSKAATVDRPGFVETLTLIEAAAFAREMLRLRGETRRYIPRPRHFDRQLSCAPVA